MLQEDQYCSACATRLELRESDDKQRPVCPQCSRVVYYDPKVAATCVVERDGKILMVRRANQPGYGLWSMPGGYVDRGEVVEQAASREVLEETGLNVEVERLIGVFSEQCHPVIVIAFVSQEAGGVLKAGPEALDVGFFSPCELPPLAFERDREILAKWRALSNEH